ncbi:MAG: hypothetical protein QOD11_1837 [Bradyrhizobium sp.]|nr:hypothetical protein [Bradyrhizobium sp.]
MRRVPDAVHELRNAGATMGRSAGRDLNSILIKCRSPAGLNGCAQEQQLPCLWSLNSGSFHCRGDENEKGRRAAGLSEFSRVQFDDQYFATSGPPPQLIR